MTGFWVSVLTLTLLRFQMETYQVAPDKPTHGYDGPLKISHGGIYTNMGQQFLEVAAQYDKTRATTDDPSDMIGINAYGVSLMLRFSHSPNTPFRDGRSTSSVTFQADGHAYVILQVHRQGEGSSLGRPA